ncbi:MAG: hypothetical protein QME42_10520, partial [bacterium]|nr:hypothetical protein [bacterium]
MKYIDLYHRLEKEGLFIFNLSDLSRLSCHKKDLVKRQVSHWKKKGWIRPLKKGLYEAIYPTRRILADLFIANKLYEPSYISLETALSYYSLIPEVALQVTSITTKPTREFRNHYGYFQYRSVKKEAFVGYQLRTEQGRYVKIAEPEKALIDYIYFALRDKNTLNIENLRLSKLKLK